MRPHVYLVEAAHGIMSNEHRDAVELIEQQMVRDGVKVLCCGKHLHVEKTESGKRLTVGSHGSQYDVTVDELLVAVRMWKESGWRRRESSMTRRASR
jgi:pyruvate/2-oxoglutarate dehydrogenase complex dihydrolipoamide dehydrogenase (E3) component